MSQPRQCLTPPTRPDRRPPTDHTTLPPRGAVAACDDQGTRGAAGALRSDLLVLHGVLHDRLVHLLSPRQEGTMDSSAAGQRDIPHPRPSPSIISLLTPHPRPSPSTISLLTPHPRPSPST
eukprot:2035527-Prymnesium_polylepis.1